MKNKLLLIAVLLMTSMITKAQENSSEELKLVSDNVEIPVGKQYRMYIEQYSTKISNNLSLTF